MILGLKNSLFIIFAFILLIFTGCGGGGGDDSSSNEPPVANAGPDQTVSVPESETATITLTGTASDEDGRIVSHQWAVTNGTVAILSGANTATVALSVEAQNATYRLKYTVTDDDGDTDSDDITITVVVNNPPVVDAGSDQTVSLSGSETATVTLTGTASDVDGQIVDHLWEQTSGTSVTLSGEATATATFIATASAQTYTFFYTATDDDDAESSDSVTITVNLKPTVNAGMDQTVTGSQTVTLTGTASDEDGEIVDHLWEQTSGTSVGLTGEETATATFTPPNATEAYTFSYTVTDDSGAQSTDSVTVYGTKSIYSDTFTDDTITDNIWQAVNETANEDAWIVDTNNGYLVQTRFLETDENFDNDAFVAGTSYHLGSYVYLNDVLDGIADYRFSVDITPKTNTDILRQGNDVGILFRRQDSNNYYRLSMNARYGFTRLEKRVGGVFSTLAVNSIGYIDEETTTITVEANDDTIVIWIDGVPVFATVDSDLSTGTIALYCQDRTQFDNVRITEPPLQPLVAISEPLAYSVTPNDWLDIKAIVLNQPTGSSVVVSLDGGSDTFATFTGSYYTIAFSGLRAINHDVMVSLRDTDGEEISYDINSTVGTGGDYYVTVGDSITNGMQDENPANNDTSDGRTVAIQGYQASLADQLTSTLVLPQIVFNEGIGGDTAQDLYSKIDSILLRHPNANKVLVMIGTNDSNSGVTDTVYYNIVNALAAKIDDTYGMQVWLALPPRTYVSGTWTLDTTRNNTIEDYISRIQSISSADPDDNTFVGPDFYTAFDNTDYYYDNLHPDDVGSYSGYQLMADEWHDTLTE